MTPAEFWANIFGKIWKVLPELCIWHFVFWMVWGMNKGNLLLAFIIMSGLWGTVTLIRRANAEDKRKRGDYDC